MGWASADHSAADDALEVACEMADVFGARHLQSIGPYEGSIGDAARAFARVCDRAAESELRVAIEFLPPNNIPDAGVALDIVKRADRPNGGVCVDVWHHFREARDEELIRALPFERIVSSRSAMAPSSPPMPTTWRTRWRIGWRRERRVRSAGLPRDAGRDRLSGPTFLRGALEGVSGNAGDRRGPQDCGRSAEATRARLSSAPPCRNRHSTA